MAPEMALGEQIDGRADLYALGCVAYFLLTGRVVFESAGALQAIARHLNDAPPPLAQHAKFPVPAALEQLVMRLLAKRPDDRPGSAAELARLLAEIELDPWTEEDARQWWNGIRSPGEPVPV